MEACLFLDSFAGLTPPFAAPHQDGSLCLYMAAHNGHAEAARLLLEHKADVNAAGKVPFYPPRLPPPPPPPPRT